MKKFILVLILALGFVNVRAQSSAKSVYFELGGAGLASVNYDMRFKPRNDGLGFRAGVGGFTVEEVFYGGSDRTTVITFPLEVNYLLGKDNRHFFEIGAGATLISLRRKETYPDYYYYDSDEKFTETFGHLYFGYRLQPANGGFLFRAGMTPIFGNGFFIPYFAGVSFGYKF